MIFKIMSSNNKAPVVNISYYNSVIKEIFIMRAPLSMSEDLYIDKRFF